MHSRRSFPRLILAGLILSAVPAMSLTRQTLTSAQPVQVILPVTLMTVNGNIQVSTEINQLELTKLTGANNMAIGDVIYVHLNISPVSIDENLYRISYAYGVSQNRPSRIEERTVSLRGIVTDRDADTISVCYLFETLPAQSSLSAAVQGKPAQGEMTLAINRRAVGRVKSIVIEGQTFSMRR